MQRTWRITLAGLAAVTLLAGAGTTARAGEDEIDRGFFKQLYSKQAGRFYQEPVSLTTIRKNPQNYLNVYFRSWVRFHREESLDTPEYTPFNREKYMNFSVWAQDARLWEEAARINDLPFCFAEKDDRVVYQVTQLGQYDMMLIYGVVRSVFMEEPWIEVIEIEKAAKSTLNDALLTHISFAESLVADGGGDLDSEAIDEYTRALSYDVTSDVAAELWKRKGLIYLKLKRYDEALYTLRQSIGHFADDPSAHLALAEAAAGAGRYTDGLRAAQHALRLEGRQARAYALIGRCWRESTLKRLEALGINVSEQIAEALRRRREDVRPSQRYRGQRQAATDAAQVSFLISDETKRKLRDDLEAAVREGRKALFLDPIDAEANSWLQASKKALEEFDQRIKEAEEKRRGAAEEAAPAEGEGEGDAG